MSDGSAFSLPLVLSVSRMLLPPAPFLQLATDLMLSRSSLGRCGVQARRVGKYAHRPAQA